MIHSTTMKYTTGKRTQRELHNRYDLEGWNCSSQYFGYQHYYFSLPNKKASVISVTDNNTNYIDKIALASFSNKEKATQFQALIFIAAAKSLQSCPTLCDPIDGSPPGSPVPGILQAKTLEWVSVSFSNAWKGKVNYLPHMCNW